MRTFRDLLKDSGLRTSGRKHVACFAKLLAEISSQGWYMLDYVGKALARDRNVINDRPVCQEGSEDSERSDWANTIA